MGFTMIWWARSYAKRNVYPLAIILGKNVGLRDVNTEHYPSCHRIKGYSDWRSLCYENWSNL